MATKGFTNFFHKIVAFQKKHSKKYDQEKVLHLIISIHGEEKNKNTIYMITAKSIKINCWKKAKLQVEKRRKKEKTTFS